jgi:two-component system OmpR family sensor kinase
VIHLGVRPIKSMTATATAIAGGELSHRVPDVAPGTEAGELGTALNSMLGRIEDAFDERSRSEERLRRFVADASHELRTPVTTIRGYAELYRSGGLVAAEELDEALRRTEQEAVRMGRLVEDLLALTRLDQGRPLAAEPVDLAAVASDAGRDARAVAPDRVITIDTAGPLVVSGDDDRLRQVVANVVGNALVHTEPGSPIEIRAEAVPGGRARLEVVDHGAGMPPEVAARAFERFFRADPSRSRHRGGTGLGLAIVEAAVGAHGGSVELDSAPGRGTTVRIELPLDPG